MDDGYFSLSGVNWSSLKWLRESALIYKYRLEAGLADTPALALGRVTHTLVFEPAKFNAEYAIWTEGDRRGNAWKEFANAHAHQTIFKPAEIETAIAMAESVRRHPLVQRYLDGGMFEQPIRWVDPDTGLHCKAKPDWLLPKQRVLLDLKSAVSIDGRKFGAAAARYGYHGQLAHYKNGVSVALDWEPARVIIVAVEKEPPHDVAVFELDEEALFAGSEEVRTLLLQLKACRDADVWPGRYTEEQALQLPAWMFTDEDDTDGFGLIQHGEAA